MPAALLARTWRRLPWLAALLLCTAGAALAQQQDDPPGRVGVVTVREGGVVFAPEGEEEWVDLPANRPLTAGDRLWTDEGARAELHLGTATLHLDGQAHLGVSALDERAAHFILTQGNVNARVRDLTEGENFEIGTPNLALRASQPGDFRIDVSADGSETRVAVARGSATVFGDGGRALQLAAGQQASFTGRALAQVPGRGWRLDDFGQWAAERNRAEDASIAARHVPRGVVGYPQLDAHGSWSHDPAHGTVWYPHVTVQDWAPYRYGRWSWLEPWGWTWIDDAPWGFAPFHYGRWASIGSRWAWVPGRMVARPVYAPALVVFFGGGSFALDSGPGLGWYPLAPGEAWYPSYRASPRYLGFANFDIDLRQQPRHFHDHQHRRHARGVTVAPERDFHGHGAVRPQWRHAQPGWVDRAQFGVAPARPQFRDRPGFRDRAGGPAVHAAPPALRREGRFDDRRAIREQFQAQREQQRLQWEAQRAARRQQHEAWQQRRGDERFGAPQLRPSFPQPPQFRMQPPPRQEVAPIGGRRGERFERFERGERGQRGEGRGRD